jgi:hypothetical protein
MSLDMRWLRRSLTYLVSVYRSVRLRGTEKWFFGSGRQIEIQFPRNR